MLVLHLVLYSPEPAYRAMKALTEKWYARFLPVVTTVYYHFDADITTPLYNASEMLLRLPGNESYLPGILQKTLDAFAFFQHRPYDYIVRSNASSVIDFGKLVPQLNQQLYAGGSIFNLQWLDPSCGIRDNTLFGLLYAHGTCIIIYKPMVNFMLANIDRVDMSLIDDVAIGKFFRDQAGIVPTGLGHQHHVNSASLTHPQGTVYRNKSANRETDIANMARTIKRITPTKICLHMHVTNTGSARLLNSTLSFVDSFCISCNDAASMSFVVNFFADKKVPGDVVLGKLPTHTCAHMDTTHLLLLDGLTDKEVVAHAFDKTILSDDGYYLQTSSKRHEMRILRLNSDFSLVQGKHRSYYEFPTNATLHRLPSLTIVLNDCP